MTKMFYTIYSPSKDKFLSRDGSFALFESAIRFASHLDAQEAVDEFNTPDGLRVVGPCVPGDYK